MEKERKRKKHQRNKMPCLSVRAPCSMYGMQKYINICIAMKNEGEHTK